MAETVTCTEETISTVQKIAWDWLSAADGSVGAVAGATTTNVYSGELLRAVFVPDAGGTQPTDQFDVQVLDEDGYDVLAGQGANLSNAATTTVVASLGAIANDKAKLSITNAGDSKGGVVYLYIR